MSITVLASGANRSAKPWVFASGANRQVKEVWVYSGGANRKVFTWFAVTSTNVTGQCFRVSPGPCTATTNMCNSTVSGGSGSFSYSWERLSGDVFTVNNPTYHSTTFSISSSTGEAGFPRSAVYRLTVTDTVTGDAVTVDINVSTTHYYSI